MIKFLKIKHSMVNSLVVSKVRVKISPKGLRHVIVATSNKVGVNMPQGIVSRSNLKGLGIGMYWSNLPRKGSKLTTLMDYI